MLLTCFNKSKDKPRITTNCLLTGVYLSKVELERALVEAEQESEVAALQQEKDALEGLHNKMADLETKSQQEKEKVYNRLPFIVKQGVGWTNRDRD